MTFESHPKSTSMHEPNYEQSEKYSIANDDYTVFSVIPLGLRKTSLTTLRFWIIGAYINHFSHFLTLCFQHYLAVVYFCELFLI